MKIQKSSSLAQIIKEINLLADLTATPDDFPGAETGPSIGDFTYEWFHINLTFDYMPPVPYTAQTEDAYFELTRDWKQPQALAVGPLLILRLNRHTERALEIWTGPIDPELAGTLPASVSDPHKALLDWLAEHKHGEIPEDIVDAIDISPANPYILAHGDFMALRRVTGIRASEPAVTALITEALIPELNAALRRLCEVTQMRNDATFRNRQPRRTTDDQRTETSDRISRATSY